MKSGEKTFTANWTANTYNIIYNLNGGTNDGSNPSTYTPDSDDIHLADPSRDGYEFRGWLPWSTIDS